MKTIIIGWIIILILTALLYFLICKLIKEFSKQVSKEIADAKQSFHDEVVKAVKEAVAETKDA